jgi:hypothetical protein
VRSPILGVYFFVATYIPHLKALNPSSHIAPSPFLLPSLFLISYSTFLIFSFFIFIFPIPSAIWELLCLAHFRGRVNCFSFSIRRLKADGKGYCFFHHFTFASSPNPSPSKLSSSPLVEGLGEALRFQVNR